MNTSSYPALEKFSKTIGIPPQNLVEAFEIEKEFHKKILAEKSFEKRQQLYEEVYNRVHPIYGKMDSTTTSTQNPKDPIVRMFEKELSGKSILDVGCGEGHFLISVAKNLSYKKLAGIDVSRSHLSQDNQNIKFILGNIIDFKLDETFDVVFSDQVFEHIAPADIPTHLASIRAALNENGLFILNLPNRLFGPSDVTRIIDCSYSGKVQAQGTHINESTYTEIIPVLKANGFTNFKTICFLPKVRNFLRDLRFSPSLLVAMENNHTMLKLLRSCKRQGRCVMSLSVSLICTRT